jgi:hypothetical protein
MCSLVVFSSPCSLFVAAFLLSEVSMSGVESTHTSGLRPVTSAWRCA